MRKIKTIFGLALILALITIAPAQRLPSYGVGTFYLNGITLTAQTTGFTIAGGSASRTLTLTANSTIDQDLATTASPTFIGHTSTTLTLKGTGAYNTTFQAGGATSSKTYTLPLTDGTDHQVLYTNGSAVLSWGDAVTAVPTGLTWTSATRALSLTANYTIPGTANVLTVPYGGTGAATYALNGVLYGNAASAIGATAIGAVGQILRVGASPFVPAWTTAAYPATAGAAGNVLVSDGTDFASGAVLTAVPTGLTYTTATRALSLTSGYQIPTTLVASNAALAASGVLTTTLADTSYGHIYLKETTAKGEIYTYTGTTLVPLTANAAYTVTKDNALTVNVYFEGGVLKVQNLTALAINVKVNFVGII